MVMIGKMSSDSLRFATEPRRNSTQAADGPEIEPDLQVRLRAKCGTRQNSNPIIRISPTISVKTGGSSLSQILRIHRLTKKRRGYTCGIPLSSATLEDHENGC